MLKTLFGRKKPPTTTELVQAYRETLHQQADIEAQADQLRRAIATGEVEFEAGAGDLRTIETRLSIVSAGLREIRQRLKQVVADDLVRNHESLSQRQSELAAEMEFEAHRAGQLLGECLSILSSLPMAFAGRLADELRMGYEEGSKPYLTRPGPFQSFSEGVLGAAPYPRDLRSELSECASIGACPTPGSSAFEQKVNLLVARMLGDPEKRDPIRINFPVAAAPAPAAA